MIRAALPLFATAALLAACQRSTETPAAPAEPAATPQAAPAAPAGKADPKAIWSRGVGALGAHTPFTVEAVQAAFPDAKVETAFLHAGGAPVPIITAFMDDTTALELQGGPDGKVSRILVQGGGFHGPQGETLLQKWPDAKFTPADCRMGEGRQVNAVVCKRAPADPIEYVFGVPGWTSSDMPPADVLAARAQLNEFVWTRP
ncbi:DUF1131 family protein [Caulobacter sp. 17J65-9]|uniref:DUF1131 family protein n=1 Tax=Caulobacter sp. 17J65-9 TaxID=2709382 RepID=UPI0013CD580F|nr:DUF1131 family protein [Caulobacter sp. 17J65-9]NEX91495.1 DUF1131 domain-containing protein [Caulobacter sp. 17J65-9]